MELPKRWVSDTLVQNFRGDLQTPATPTVAAPGRSENHRSPQATLC